MSELAEMGMHMARGLLALGRGRRSGRVIEFLRREYPGNWKYDWPDWIRDDGLTANFESHLSPRYPEDDETCVTYLKIGETAPIYWRG